MIVNALSQLYDLAIYYQLSDKNPALEVKCIKSSNKAGIKAWMPVEIAAYEAKHKAGPKARLELDFMLSRANVVAITCFSVYGILPAGDLY